MLLLCLVVSGLLAQHASQNEIGCLGCVYLPAVNFKRTKQAFQDVVFLVIILTSNGTEVDPASACHADGWIFLNIFQLS